MIARRAPAHDEKGCGLTPRPQGLAAMRSERHDMGDIRHQRVDRGGANIGADGRGGGLQQKGREDLSCFPTHTVETAQTICANCGCDLDQEPRLSHRASRNGHSAPHGKEILR
ncbi:hypothetical protein [Pontitalea aquivivens]|uniref:hypothetical protein n=1 Tax=Pontitalea aquivivens TaxID=3388663 RepID=UPI003970A61A